MTTMMLDVFPRDYDYELLEELPADAGAIRYYYPGATTGGGRDGVTIRVTAESHIGWIGTFAFGHYGRGATIVTSTPDRTRICVVSRGCGYFVSAPEPRNWMPLEVIPVVDVRAIADLGVIVFASLTKLSAYGREGLRWRSGRLAWDGFEIIEVTSTTLVGRYWDLRSEEYRPFEVDARTGVSQGGVDRIS